MLGKECAKRTTFQKAYSFKPQIKIQRAIKDIRWTRMAWDTIFRNLYQSSIIYNIRMRQLYWCQTKPILWWNDFGIDFGIKFTWPGDPSKSGTSNIHKAHQNKTVIIMNTDLKYIGLVQHFSSSWINNYYCRSKHILSPWCLPIQILLYVIKI